jgi:integrase
MAREPGYCHHKPTGQAYVRFNGKTVYLGPYGSPESKERYDRLKAEWLLNRHTAAFNPCSTGPTMADVALAYLAHAETYYALSTEYVNLKLAIRPVSKLYATLPAKEFGTVQFRSVREWWLSDPSRSRQYVNKQMKRLVRIIKWAVANGMMPTENYVGIKCVDPLKRGRTEAIESEPIKPVGQFLVDATIENLTPVLAAMVRFQQLVGCRPGELVRITPSMVDRSGDVWTISLKEHKTAYRGKSRTLYLGPKAQAILKPYLLRGADDPCFSPQESESQRLAVRHENRRTSMSCGNRPGVSKTRNPKRSPSRQYTTGSYARAIKYACQRAKLEHWHPNQLRHSAATAIRKEFGIDAASVILGHSSLDVTQVYAEKDEAKAKEIARRIG